MSQVPNLLTNLRQGKRDSEMITDFFQYFKNGNGNIFNSLSKSKSFCDIGLFYEQIQDLFSSKEMNGVYMNINN